jgi:hypothetical protein
MYISSIFSISEYYHFLIEGFSYMSYVDVYIFTSFHYFFKMSQLLHRFMYFILRRFFWRLDSREKAIGQI